MPGSAAKDIKFGFWAGAGFLLLFILASFIVGMAGKALATG
jgi:hypothetical protein